MKKRKKKLMKSSRACKYSPSLNEFFKRNKSNKWFVPFEYSCVCCEGDEIVHKAFGNRHP